MEPLRVLVAESNLQRRQAIARLLGPDSGMEVIGTAIDGKKAVAMIADLRPDIVLIGSGLKTAEALAATREIMIEHPTPVLVVTSDRAPVDVDLAVQALRAGALSVIPLPTASEPGFEKRREEFLGAITALSQVKLVRRWRQRAGKDIAAPFLLKASDRDASVRIVAIASSTGGPGVLELILRSIPEHFPAPILIVQHISPGFIAGVASWLDHMTPLDVRVAEQGERLAPGTVYLAPDNHHLGVSRAGRVCLSDAPPINGFRPSANHLFKSVAESFGESALGVILTGMGSDGVDGLISIHQAGGRVIAQDEASSVVFGMPRGAIELGIADEVLPAARIGEAIQASVVGINRDATDERPLTDRRG
jgi:two-component system chemotaxis response regulator CheB